MIENSARKLGFWSVLVAFKVIILTINWIVLIASGALLSVLFRRDGDNRP